MEAGFIVIDKHGCGDVHGIDQYQSVNNPALPDAGTDIIRDVHKGHTLGKLEGEFLAVGFHDASATIS